MLSFRSLAVLACCLPAVWGRAVLNPRAITPLDDPFYIPPSGFESSAPGTIFRTRQVTSSFLEVIPDPVETYQILYRTTAINGTAITSVTTVFKPVNPKTDRFVSFQTAYDSAAPKCSPSYDYQEGGDLNVITEFEFLIVQLFLLSGYIVSSSDYEISLEAAFGAGRLEGTAALDSMRAVSNFYSTLGFSNATPDIVGVGYSGGAIATGWAAALQPSYAPELSIKGWSIGGTPANLTGTLEFIDGSLFSGFIAPALAGLTKPSAYGATLGSFVASILTSDGQSKVDFALNNCGVSDVLNWAFGSLYSPSIQTYGDDLLYAAPVTEVLADCTLGTDANEVPTAPVFLYHALGDEIIPYANASTLADSWCQDGANLQFTTYAHGGHISTEILSVPYVYGFVQDAFAGSADITGCSRLSRLTDDLDVLSLGADLEPVLVQLANLLHEIGLDDAGLVSNLTARV